MSTNLLTKDDLNVVSYWAGATVGMRVEVSLNDTLLSFNLGEANAVRLALTKFVETEALRRQELLRTQLDSMPSSEKNSILTGILLDPELVFSELSGIDLIDLCCPISGESK